MVEEHIAQAMEELEEILEDNAEYLGIEHKLWDIYESVYYSILKGKIVLIGVKEEADGKRKRETYAVYDYNPDIQHALEVFLRYVKAYKHLKKAIELLDFSDFQGAVSLITY